MGYTNRANTTLPLGCLPAGIFGFVVGAPAGFVTIMGECIDATGSVGNCPNEGLELLAIIAVTASLCLLIVWATNRMVAALEARGRASAWGVVGGFVLGAALVVVLYTTLVVFS